MDDERGDDDRDELRSGWGGESIQEWWGERNESGSWFRRRGDAYVNERSVIFKDEMGWRARKSDNRWGAGTARRLKRDKVVKIARLGSFKNFVSKLSKFIEVTAKILSVLISGHSVEQFYVNPLECKGNYSATSNNMKLVTWYTGCWWVGCYILYRDEGPGRGRSPRSFLGVPNVTAHPLTASVPVTVLLYSGWLLCVLMYPLKG